MMIVNSPNDSYYYGQFVIFKVENTLFRLPAYQLEDKSEVFRYMYNLPNGQDPMAEGLNDERPIELEGVSVADFEIFVGKILYPRGIPPTYDLTLEEWKAVLRLADRWKFEGVCKFAVERMTPLIFKDEDSSSTASSESVDDSFISLVDAALLAREYGVRSWLVRAYDGLICREEPITIEEAKKPGPEETVLLAQVRERCITSSEIQAIVQSTCYIERVEHVFEEKLKGMRTLKAGARSS